MELHVKVRVVIDQSEKVFQISAFIWKIKTAITHNEIIESIAITARKTIITVIVTMSLKSFSATGPIQRNELAHLQCFQWFHFMWSCSWNFLEKQGLLSKKLAWLYCILFNFLFQTRHSKFFVKMWLEEKKEGFEKLGSFWASELSKSGLWNFQIKLTNYVLRSCRLG